MPTLPTPTVREVADFWIDTQPLRDKRWLMRISQAELASVIRLSYMTVWRIENGKLEPTLAQMVAFARALGIPMSQLFIVRDGRRPPQLSTISGGKT